MIHDDADGRWRWWRQRRMIKKARSKQSSSSEGRNIKTMKKTQCYASQMIFMFLDGCEEKIARWRWHAMWWEKPLKEGPGITGAPVIVKARIWKAVFMVECCRLQLWLLAPHCWLFASGFASPFLVGVAWCGKSWSCHMTKNVLWRY